MSFHRVYDRVVSKMHSPDSQEKAQSTPSLKARTQTFSLPERRHCVCLYSFPQFPRLTPLHHQAHRQTETGLFLGRQYCSSLHVCLLYKVLMVLLWYPQTSKLNSSFSVPLSKPLTLCYTQ